MRKRVLLSLTLILTLMVVFSLSSFAVPNAATTSANELTTLPEAVANPSLPLFDPQDQAPGTLTGTGTFYINGNTAQSGATVTSGSSIKTDLDGEVVLDLGVMGRIKIRPDTEIKVTFGSGKVEVIIEKLGSFTANLPAGSTIQGKTKDIMLAQVATTTGEVRVQGRLHFGDDQKARSDSPTGDVIIRVDENRVFDSVDNLTASGDTTFTVNGCDCEKKAAPVIIFPYTLLALAGVTAGVIAGVTTSSPRPRVTPVQS
jgi:hypothetical protein